MLRLHVMNSIEGLGWSLIGIFIPIYFLKLGFSLPQVFVYYIIQNSVICLGAFLVIFLEKFISIKKIFIIRFPILLLFLGILYYLQDINFPLYILAFIDGLQAAFYFIPLHVLFSGFAQERKLGRETGKLLAIPQVVAMFGPLIGGLIILNSNFKVLYLTAIILFAIDFIPILYTQIPGIKYEFKFGEGINLYKKYRKFFKAEIFSNIGEEIEGVIWPIFVYVSLINVASVGMIGTLLALSSAFFTFAIGKLSDKKDKSSMMRYSVVFIAMVWVFRFIFDNEPAFYILTFFSGIFYVVFSVPYYSFFYRISQKEKATVFFAFREIPVAIARVIVFSLAIVFAANLKILFLVAGGAYLYFIFWKKVE